MSAHVVYCRWLITVGSKLIKCSINLHKDTNPELTGSNPLSCPKGDVDGGL